MAWFPAGVVHRFTAARCYAATNGLEKLVLAALARDWRRRAVAPRRVRPGVSLSGACRLSATVFVQESFNYIRDERRRWVDGCNFHIERPRLPRRCSTTPSTCVRGESPRCGPDRPPWFFVRPGILDPFVGTSSMSAHPHPPTRSPCLRSAPTMSPAGGSARPGSGVCKAVSVARFSPYYRSRSVD